MRNIIVMLGNFAGAYLIFSQVPHNGYSMWFAAPGVFIVAICSYLAGRAQSR